MNGTHGIAVRRMKKSIRDVETDAKLFFVLRNNVIKFSKEREAGIEKKEDKGIEWEIWRGGEKETRSRKRRRDIDG